jgi:hypothetical protein
MAALILPITSRRLTLPGVKDYTFVSGNYCFGGRRNGCIYNISSALRKEKEDTWLPYPHEYAWWQKDT